MRIGRRRLGMVLVLFRMGFVRRLLFVDGSSGIMMRLRTGMRFVTVFGRLFLVVMGRGRFMLMVADMRLFLNLLRRCSSSHLLGDGNDLRAERRRGRLGVLRRLFAIMRIGMLVVLVSFVRGIRSCRSLVVMLGGRRLRLLVFGNRSFVMRIGRRRLGMVLVLFRMGFMRRLLFGITGIGGVIGHGNHLRMRALVSRVR